VCERESLRADVREGGTLLWSGRLGLMVLMMMVVAMNVPGGLNREKIVDSRLDSMEENRNQKSKKELSPKQKKKRKVLSEVGIEKMI